MLLLTIFLAGILHGLGPDHLAAITAFGAVVGHDFRRVFYFSVRFAAGHAVVILAAALLAHFGRLAMPASWERGFDITAAAILLLTGIAMFAGLLTGRISLHSHTHHHGHGEHHHVHAHLGDPVQHEHGHGRLAFLIGGLFALGGARGLLVIIPVALAQTLTESLLRVAAFAFGIVVSMAAYGLVASGVLGRTQEVASVTRQRLVLRITTAAVASFCVIAALLTLSERLHS
jgi:ABC-type nickel/cobalt efflux system permease component RcnA